LRRFVNGGHHHKARLNVPATADQKAVDAQLQFPLAIAAAVPNTNISNVAYSDVT
jgi:hypothetical protein